MKVGSDIMEIRPLILRANSLKAVKSVEGIREK